MRQSRSAVYVHLVWATWNRLPLLTGEVDRAAQRGIGAKCAELGAEVIALGGIEDHVHLLVHVPSTVSVAQLVGQVKGASAHLITHEVLKDGDFFKWQGAYGSVSVSPRHLGAVARYIANQRQHHAAGTTSPGMELPALPRPAQAPAERPAP